MATSDEIGSRGEWIFQMRVTQPLVAGDDPLFHPHFLGDKFATFDFLLELTGLTPSGAYCFIQVKATTQGYTKRIPARLKVGLAAIDVQNMVACPAPSYVVGVDVRNEQAYIASVNGSDCDSFSSLKTTYPLVPENLQKLWAEVREFWATRDTVLRGSAFKI